MPLTGVHFLLSYQCTHECDHCFVWAGPRAGGPAELVRVFGLPHESGYVDACHLCYEARCALRERFPEHPGPPNVYSAEETR